MALASATPKSFKLMHLTPITCQAQIATTSDCVTFPNCKGVINVFGTLMPIGNSITMIPTEPTLVYGAMLVNNAGTAYSATSTSIVYDAATCMMREVPYYVRTNLGEIMEVTADSGSHTIAGTLTVRRGCLGTTAAAGTITLGGVQDNAPLQVMNTVLVGATAGYVILYGQEMPQDPAAPLYKTAPR